MSETRKRDRRAARKKKRRAAPSSQLKKEIAGYGAPKTEWTESFPQAVCDLYQIHYWLANLGFDTAHLFVTHRNVVTAVSALGGVESSAPHACTELRLPDHPPFVVPCTPSPHPNYAESEPWFEDVVASGWLRLSREKSAHSHEELDRIVERGRVIPRERVTELMTSLLFRGIPLPHGSGEPLPERLLRPEAGLS